MNESTLQVRRGLVMLDHFVQMMGVLTVNESECCGVNPKIRITPNNEDEIGES